MGASPRKSKSFARPDSALSRRRFLALASIAATGPFVHLRRAGAAKITMKVAHVLTEADIIHRATAKFKELAERKSGGDLEVQIYPTSALGSLRVTWESMQLATWKAATGTRSRLPCWSPCMRAPSCRTFTRTWITSIGCLTDRSGRSWKRPSWTRPKSAPWPCTTPPSARSSRRPSPSIAWRT